SGDSAKLGDNAIDIILANDAEGTLTNYFVYPIADTYFADNSWTFFKIALSVIDDSTVGSPSLNSITGLSISLADAPSAEVTISFENFQLIKKAQGGAWPNAFQTETTNDVWEVVWKQESGKNVTIVAEPELGVMSLDATSSRLDCARTFEDYSISGIIKASGANDHFMTPAGSDYFRTYGSNVRLTDSLGGTHDKAFNPAEGDIVYWQFDREGTAITGRVSFTGLSGDWVSVSTFTKSGARTIRLYTAE
ncbi:unnamed protein product, partial [marine sediment metagenome]